MVVIGLNGSKMTAYTYAYLQGYARLDIQISKQSYFKSKNDKISHNAHIQSV